METFYSAEVNVQMLIYLMKAHGIKRVIISPGATNVAFGASLQQDPDFEIYSAVDERSAAYTACGMAAESGQPVAISCTGATAARNYFPALTEAFYRKLPILTITSSQKFYRIGDLSPQFTDRTHPPKDIARTSLFLPIPHDNDELTAYTVKLNAALLELTRNGGGPVHVNLETSFSRDFSVKELPEFTVIKRLFPKDKFPSPKTIGNRVAILVGSHAPWSKSLTAAVESFCEKYNAYVLCDHTSNYTGKYKIFFALLSVQEGVFYPCQQPDLLIHIGETSGAYFAIKAANVWRVSPDGELRNTFKNLRLVFEMSEEEFFIQYAGNDDKPRETASYKNASFSLQNILKQIPDVPFSNIWMAHETAPLLPPHSVLHLAILNSLRAWNFFDVNPSITRFSNVGGFGIDGCASTLLGASLAAPNKLFFGIIGDLAFFYDMNFAGSRHLDSNLRLLLVNNGRGTEFRMYNNYAAQFGDNTDKFIAAAGHYGKQSRDLVKHYARDLGFEYLTASNKEEYLKFVKRFTAPQRLPRPIIFEVFTDSQDESDALRMIRTIIKRPPAQARAAAPAQIKPPTPAPAQVKPPTPAPAQVKPPTPPAQAKPPTPAPAQAKPPTPPAQVKPPTPTPAPSTGTYFPKPPFFCGDSTFAGDVLHSFGQYEILDASNEIDFDTKRFIVFFGADYAKLKTFFALKGMVEGKDYMDGRKLFRPVRIRFGKSAADKLTVPTEKQPERPKPTNALLPPREPQLGFGVMRLPQLENGDFDLEETRRMFDEYMKGDFCYFDTHPFYCKKQSQSIVRELVVKRYPRDKFLLAGKMYWPIRNPDEYEKIFVNELKDCGVEYFDYYLLHALSEKYANMHEELGGFEFLKRLKAKGFVRRIGFSFHDKPEVLDAILSRHPEIEIVQLQLNYMDWEDPFVQSRRLYETAKKYGKQISVMEPIKGGSLANLDKLNIGGGIDRATFAKMALRFVASLGVSIILSGMSATEHVIANRQTLAEPVTLTEEEQATYRRIREAFKSARLIPCTACRYCEAECPKKIVIPDILSLLNQCGHTGENDTTYLGRFKILYASATQNRGRAGECIACGRCENRCPQGIEIREHMREAKKLFEYK